MSPFSSPASLARQYQADTIKTASKEKILMMMFDGALRFARQAQTRMRDRDVAGAGLALGRLQAIIGELNAALDHSIGGETSRNLARLYQYASECIVASNISRRAEGLDIVVKIVTAIREGFDGAIRSLAQ
ncbi:MAG: flagellar export chaperone FliS [Planctomycetota bacterium]